MVQNALILEDDTTLAAALGKVVGSLGYDVSIAGSVAEARQWIKQRTPSFMLIDVNLPDGDGLDLMSELQDSVGSNFVVITGDSSQQVAVKCIRAKAFDMLAKPIRLADLRDAITRAEKARNDDVHEGAKFRRSSVSRVEQSTLGIGSSIASVELRTMIGQGASSKPCLLVIEGETGVEKNSVAEAVHERSQRRGRLITVNCAGEVDANAHSRFFGLEADAQGRGGHQGYIEQAAGGTLVLDDVTQLSLDLQARLLTFIDNGQFLRTNGLKPVKAHVGLIGIARGSISAALDSGELRADFYYRLAQFNIAVPRLQQRADDIVAIAEHLLIEINERNGTRKVLTDEARDAIVNYTWPGNVRELKNALHRGCIDSPSLSTITLKDLEQQGGSDRQNQQIAEFVGKTFWQIEKELLFATLEHHGGDKDRTAKTLGISLKTLYNRLHAYS